MSHSVCPPEGHTVLQEKWQVYPYNIQNLGMCQTKLSWLSGFPCRIMSHYFCINHSSYLENIIFSHLNLLKKIRHLHMHTHTHTHTHPSSLFQLCPCYIPQEYWIWGKQYHINKLTMFYFSPFLDNLKRFMYNFSAECILKYIVSHD